MAARIDLKKVNATTLFFAVPCIVSNAIRAELETLLGGSLKESKRMVFGAAHRKGEDKWVDIAIAEYTEVEAAHLHMAFTYGIKGIPPPPRNAYKPRRLLEILSLLDEPLTFSCHVSFLYEKGATKSVIQLPIPLFRTDKVGFHEIKGVELLRREPADSKYEVGISVEEDESLSHEVVFDYKVRARPGIEGDLLKKSCRDFAAVPEVRIPW